VRHRRSSLVSLAMAAGIASTDILAELAIWGILHPLSFDFVASAIASGCLLGLKTPPPNQTKTNHQALLVRMRLAASETMTLSKRGACIQYRTQELMFGECHTCLAKFTIFWMSV
jgi:hypothetical protein